MEHDPRTVPNVRLTWERVSSTPYFRGQFLFQIVSRIAIPLRPRHSASHVLQSRCYQEIVKSARMKFFHSARLVGCLSATRAPNARPACSRRSGLYFFIGIPASLQSEFSFTSAGTENPGHLTDKSTSKELGLLTLASTDFVFAHQLFFRHEQKLHANTDIDMPGDIT